MAVAHDGTGNLDDHLASSASHTISGKTTSGSDRVGIVDVRIPNAVYGAGEPLDVTWNAVSMTEIGTGVNSGTAVGAVRSYYIINPPTSASDVVVTFTDPTPLGYTIRSFNGGTTPTNVNTGSGSDDTPTVNITSPSGDMACDCVTAGNTFSALGSGQTQDDSDQMTDGSTYVGRTSHEGGSGTVTMDHTLSAAATWVTQGFSIPAAAAGSADVTGHLLTLGAGA